MNTVRRDLSRLCSWIPAFAGMMVTSHPRADRLEHAGEVDRRSVLVRRRVAEYVGSDRVALALEEQGAAPLVDRRISAREDDPATARLPGGVDGHGRGQAPLAHRPVC